MTRASSLLAVFVTAAMTQAAEPAAGIPVGGGCFAAPGLKQIFVPANSGLEAIDTATGKTLWSNKDAAHLAGASEKLAFAWAADPKGNNVFRVCVIDAATGKLLSKSEPIALPDWASVKEDYGVSFFAAARAEGDSVVVAWRAGTHYAGGAAPTQEILDSARNDAAGLVKIDAKTGKVSAIKAQPKDADFMPAGANPKTGDYEFRMEQTLGGFGGGAPTPPKKTLTALKNGKEIWSKALTGGAFLPPRP